ncbi:MAG: formylglycine-generating enzyme family protein [Bacteriovoracales bacterium]|nr:formylglycine-generating enzyme family protein [Bacteriovoracales bacterium]
MTIRLKFKDFTFIGMGVLFLMFAYTPKGLAAKDCSKWLEGKAGKTRKKEVNEATTHFKAYVELLIERQVITDKELIRFIEALERGEIVNPISERKARVSRAALIHRKGIQIYIDETKPNPRELLEWSHRILKEKKIVRKVRVKVQEETEDIHQKMIFRPVTGKRFFIGEGIYQKEIHLTNTIEVMSTPVTQKQWTEIMGENPSYFSGGIGSTEKEVNGKRVLMRPDHPVENVTWWSMIVFANRLSESLGLKPAFDLSDIKWRKGTRAENGTLEAESGEIRINAPGGDYYLAEGFRPPTEAEQLYLLSAGGKTKGKPPFDDRDLQYYAWYVENSNGQTHPVGELKHIAIDGQEFSDLYGNVWEWGWDLYGSIPIWGKNPVRANRETYSFFVSNIFGGSWASHIRWFFPANNRWRKGQARIVPHKNVGFRLVRTIDL